MLNNQLYESGDRFISNRSSKDISQYNISKSVLSGDENKTTAEKMWSNSLAETLFSVPSVDNCKILALQNKAPAPKSGYENRLKVLYTQSLGSEKSKPHRQIPTQPVHVLNAPDMVDDFYLNLLDWSKDNVIAIALSNIVYLWNADSGNITKLIDTPDQMITSVSWSKNGQFLSVGTSNNEVQIWDANRAKQIRSMGGHNARVGSLSWNGNLLSSAGKDTSIINHDVRIRDHIVHRLNGHTQEVCGLSWSFDGKQLASGANDNLVNIWDISNLEQPMHTLADHSAAVRALAWCPYSSNTLATGGGTADSSIRFWNTQTGSCLNKIQTDSQICSLLWSRHYKEVVSTHSWNSKISVWKYPSMVNCADLKFHSSRVLHLAMSPDGTTVAGAAADGQLSFWKIWGTDSSSTTKSTTVKSTSLSRSGSITRIR